MAKSFNQIYLAAKTRAYAAAAMAMPLLASLNPAVNLEPIFKSNGAVDGSTAKYNVQRGKRIKTKTVSNANSTSTANNLAILDSFSNYDWETVGFATGIKKSIGLKKGVNEEFDMDSVGSIDAKSITDQVNAVAVDRAEALIELAIGSVPSTEIDNTVSGFNNTSLLDALEADIENVQLFSDEFKHMSDQVIIAMHPTIARIMLRIYGTSFNQPVEIAPGVSAPNSILGHAVIVDPNLNKTFNDGTPATPKSIRAAWIVMDAEALFFKAANENPIDFTLADTRYVGKSFYNVGGVIDSKRITVKTVKSFAGITATDKANA